MTTVKYFILGIVLVFIASCTKDPEVSSSQAGFFYKVFGGSATDRTNAIKLTEEGNILLTGSINLGTSEPDLFLIKTNSYGNEIEWSPKFFGTSLIEEGHSLEIDQDKNILIAGHAQSPTDQELNDFYIIKADANGEQLWSKQLGGPKADEALCSTIGQNGIYYVAGFTESIPNKDRDALLVALSSEGDSLWSRNYGGAKYDDCRSLINMGSHLLLVGSTETYDAKKRDVSLIDVNLNGGIIANTILGKEGNETGICATLNASNELIVAGSLQITNSVTNIYLWKLNQNLNQVLWETQIKTTNSEEPASILIYNEKIVVVGTTTHNSNSDMIVYVLDNSGNIISGKAFGGNGNQFATSAAITADGSLLIGGYNVTRGYSKASLFKTSDLLK